MNTIMGIGAIISGFWLSLYVYNTIGIPALGFVFFVVSIGLMVMLFRAVRDDQRGDRGDIDG